VTRTLGFVIASSPSGCPLGEYPRHRLADDRWMLGHRDARRGQDLDLLRGAFPEGRDDRAGVAHGAALGGGQARYIGDDRLRHVLMDIGGGLGLLRARKSVV